MRSSNEQIVDVLNGWKNDRRPVAMLLTAGSDGLIKFGGVVVDATLISLRIFGEGVEIAVNLSEATDFEWKDPRESPEELREESVALYEASLEIRSPSYRCVVFAFKLEDERLDI